VDQDGHSLEPQNQIKALLLPAQLALSFAFVSKIRNRGRADYDRGLE
jgi:hypothetical protein